MSASTMAPRKPYGLLARLPDPAALLQAAASVRDAGFTRWDVHTPFPLHGLEKAMGLAKSRVPLYCLVLGLSGAAAGMAMQWWVATTAYPLVISGKPFFSWPAFVPIMFECGVLGGAVGAIGGFLFESRLPRHHHSLFNSASFDRATDDGFFLSIEAVDPRYDEGRTSALLRSLGASSVEVVGA